MRITFWPNGDETLASSRLRVYKIAPLLEGLGHEVRIKPDKEVLFNETDVAVFQKVNSERVANWMRRLMDLGVRVIWDVDDPIDARMPCSAVTVGSKRLTRYFSDSIYIPDALDVSEGHVAKEVHSPNLQIVCWYGLHCNLYNCVHVYEACMQLKLYFRVITDIGHKKFRPLFPKAKYIEWGPESVDVDVVRCDVVALPYVFQSTEKFGWLPRMRSLSDWNNAKGENRLLKAWALGMPAVGAPIQAYMEQGLNETAVSTNEWVVRLNNLRRADQRHESASHGQSRVANRDNQELANRWMEVFHG